MKERPIIFSAEMVKAVLSGRKKQTRRVIKPVPVTSDGMLAREVPVWLYPKEFVKYCPYGQVGDRLWVKQAFALNYKGQVLTKAEKEYVSEMLDITEQTKSLDIKWTPSIFMPRKLSFLTLEITEVRVERVQEISEEDAIAEGVEYKTTNEHAYLRVLSQGKANRGNWPTPQESFGNLWDSFNAKRGYGWEVNPWVWVVSFKKLEAE